MSGNSSQFFCLNYLWKKKTNSASWQACVTRHAHPSLIASFSFITMAPISFHANSCRDQQSPWRGDPAPRPSSSSPPSKSLSLELQRPARAPLARSFATEELLSPSAPLKPKHSVKTPVRFLFFIHLYVYVYIMTIANCSVAVVECPSRKATELESKVEEELRRLAGSLPFVCSFNVDIEQQEKNMSIKAPQVIITSRLSFFLLLPQTEE